MKRLFFVLLIVISSFYIGTSLVQAAGEKTINISVTGLQSCGAFGNPKEEGTFAYYLQQIFNFMKFLGIIIAVIMTVKDVMNAVAEQKSETFAKLGKKSLKRFIYAVLIFFLPNILNYVFSVLGLYGTCGII